MRMSIVSGLDFREFDGRGFEPGAVTVVFLWVVLFI